MSADDDGGFAMTQQPPGPLPAPREADGLAMTQPVEAVAANAPPPLFEGFYLKAQSTAHAHEGDLEPCKFRRGSIHDGYPVCSQLVLARSPRPTADQDAVYEVEVDGRSIPALFFVNPPEISVDGIPYQIVSRQHALVEHHPGTDELELTVQGGGPRGLRRRGSSSRKATVLPSLTVQPSMSDTG